MYFLWDYLLCGFQSFSGAWESLGLWEHAFALVRGRNHALDAEFRKSGDTWDPAEILRKLEWMHTICKSGWMHGSSWSCDAARASFLWMIHQWWSVRSMPILGPKSFSGLRLSRARWVLSHMTAKSWEAVTTRNKCPIVCYTTSQAVSNDWLFRRDLRTHRNHLGSDCRRRFRACTTDRPACSQKSARLKSLFHSFPIHLNFPKQWIRKTFSFFSSALALLVSL